VRVLIVGAGVAGLTLAARLKQGGLEAIVVERDVTERAGYALGLYPLGTRVLHDLGLYDELADRASVLKRHEMATVAGRVLKSLDTSAFAGSTDPLLMVERSDLIEVLRHGFGPGIRRGVVVRSLAQGRDDVEVVLSDGANLQFDLVVGCDGADSATRTILPQPPSRYDSGWELWTWWVAPSLFDPTISREWWGAGAGFGVYPTPSRTMCGVAVPTGTTRSALESRVGALVLRESSVAAALTELSEPFVWPMRDHRCPAWHVERVALCGDAAASFLPTAGVGASYAMRGAAALADELLRSRAPILTSALSLYEKRCRAIVERGQTDSRRLAQVMFVKQSWLARVRDEVVRHYPTSRAMREIVSATSSQF
jgi:FAD-dependent urate hydroxylase